MDKCIYELFEKLHNNPECSGKEHKTKELITDFMNRNTSMTYHELPGGFYYEHRVNDSPGSIVLRADYDAVTVDEGKALHLCGHDGHSASLCQCALRIEREGVNNNVKLLFQSSEENGQGAKNCLEALDEDCEDNSPSKLKERLEKASLGLKLLLAAWARYEDETPDGIRKENVQNVREDWGKYAKDFLKYVK